MPVRTITTKLALDGETEYKAKLQKINAEILLFTGPSTRKPGC